MLLALNMKGFDIVVTTVIDTIDNIIDTSVTSSTETNEKLSVSSSLAPSTATIPKELVQQSTLSQINTNTTSTIAPPIKTTEVSQTESSTQNNLYKTALVLTDRIQTTVKTKQEKTHIQPTSLTRASTILTEKTKTQPTVLTEMRRNFTREESIPTVPSSLISDPVSESSTSTDLTLVLPLVSISLVLYLVLGLYWTCRQYKEKQGRGDLLLPGRGGSKQVWIRT